MRILTLRILEPLPGNVPQAIAPDDLGPDEAARRYRAVVLTTMRQLRGLEATTIRILTDPADANEAIRFWLLPKLSDHWENNDPDFQTTGWALSFATTAPTASVRAEADILCPFLSARWIHTALIGIERGGHRVTGPSDDGGHCFNAEPTDAASPLETRALPPLPVVKTAGQWDQALKSPLGPALKKAWKEEA
ncbi:MAG: hypothetical protein ACQCXQ_05620 [Verrucomicrobiales bacterium]|nr:hypothetical protein [Verrucomicrobiota bacterium JB025]